MLYFLCGEFALFHLSVDYIYTVSYSAFTGNVICQKAFYR